MGLEKDTIVMFVLFRSAVYWLAHAFVEQPAACSVLFERVGADVSKAFMFGPMDAS